MVEVIKDLSQTSNPGGTRAPNWGHPLSGIAMGWKNNSLVLLVPAELNSSSCKHGEQKIAVILTLRDLFLGGCLLHFQGCRAPKPLGCEPGTLGAAIPAPQRASGHRRTAKIGRERVLLSLKTAHKRIADLILARPRTLCSSLQHKSLEKLVLPAGPRDLVERLETAQRFVGTLSTQGFLCLFEGAFPAGCTKRSGGKSNLMSRDRWGSHRSCRSNWFAGASRESAVTSAKTL